MSEKDFNEIFAKNLKSFLTMYQLSQVELASKIGVSPAAVSGWVNGEKTPRMDKVDAMCKIFHCSRSDLMRDETQESKGWYTNPETAKVAQEIFDNKELRILFDAARDASPEDLTMVAELLKRMRSPHEL